MLKIALDYDQTYSAAPEMWEEIISVMVDKGHDVRIVTARSPREDNIDDRISSGIPIIYCDGVAKRFHCEFFADEYKGWRPDIWIDDKPESVDNNSKATREVLAKWREERDH